jgi:hypothetical protein
MFKSHLARWGVRKNFRFNEVCELVGQKYHSTPIVEEREIVFHGRKINPKKLETYLRRLPAAKRSEISKNTGRVLTLHTIHSAWKDPTATVSPIIHLKVPDSLRLPEECIHIMRDYLSGAFDMGLWTTHPMAISDEASRIIEYFTHAKSIRKSLRRGKTCHAFRLLDVGCDQYKHLVASQDRRLFVHTYIAFLQLADRHSDIANSIIDYACSFTEAAHKSHHLLHRLMAKMKSMDFQELQGYSRCLLESYMEFFQAHLVASSPLMLSMTRIHGFMINNLVLRGYMNLDVAEASLQRLLQRLEKHSRALETQGIKLRLAELWLGKGNYSQARAMTLSVLQSDEISGNANVAAWAHEILFSICRKEGIASRAGMLKIAESRTGHCLVTYGLGSYWTVDALDDVGMYLEEIGDASGAEKVGMDFDIALEALCDTLY